MKDTCEQIRIPIVCKKHLIKKPLNKGEIIDSGDTHQIFSNKELLKRAHLKAPVTTEILYALKEKGYNVDTTKIGLNEIVNEIINMKKED